MATWLYAAAKSKAGASRTYELAEQHGIVWRPYYADRDPPQSVPNVGDLRPGDTVYLGYRRCRQIELLGRMRLGRPDHPLAVSPVFTEVPEALAEEFRRHGYELDPILGRLVGLFVEEVEPVSGQVGSPGRLTVTQMAEDPLGEAPVEAPRTADREQSAQLGRLLQAAPVPAEEAEHDDLQRSSGLDGSFVGVDVGGRPNKGYDLCRVTWSNGVPSIAFKRVPHASALPSTDKMRPFVEKGDLTRLASLTHSSAAATAKTLWDELSRLAPPAPRGVFIDSPSGFSRNTRGHGRRAEKQSLVGVRFQSSPSLCCGRAHGGDWGWLVYGMIAFAACRHRGSFSLPQWEEALADGLHRARDDATLIVRECFPTATVSHLRASGRAAHVQQLLSPIGTATHTAVVQAVCDYLAQGVAAVKRPRDQLYDQADALVAALSSLPHVRPDFIEVEQWPSGRIRWQASAPDAHLTEGVIALVK